MVLPLLKNITGLLLGDKGYLGEGLKETLAAEDILLETPIRNNMKDKLTAELRRKFNKIRRRVETTIAQLVEQFKIQKTCARSMWSLENRLSRKLLPYSLGVLINKELGNPPLQLAKVLN